MKPVSIFKKILHISGIHRISIREIFIILLPSIIFLALYFFFPPFKLHFYKYISLLTAENIGKLKKYILSFGILAPCVSFFLMILQSVIFFLPSMPIMLANGLIFGPLWGFLLSWTSNTAGVCIAFLIARKWGRPIVELMANREKLEKADQLISKYGKYAVFIARLYPIVSFDIISYAAGITSIKFLHFIVAAGLGGIPSILLWSVGGGGLKRLNAEGWYVLPSVLIFLLFIGLIMGLSFMHSQRRD